MSILKNISDAFEATSQIAQDAYKTAIDGTYDRVINPVADAANAVDHFVEDTAIATGRAALKYGVDPVARAIPFDQDALNKMLPFALAPIGIIAGAGLTANTTAIGILAVPASLGAAFVTLSFRKSILELEDAIKVEARPILTPNGLDLNDGPQ